MREINLKLKNIRQKNMNLPEFGIEIAGYFGKYELRIDEKDEFPKLLKQVYS